MAIPKIIFLCFINITRFTPTSLLCDVCRKHIVSNRPCYAENAICCIDNVMTTVKVFQGRSRSMANIIWAVLSAQVCATGRDWLEIAIDLDLQTVLRSTRGLDFNSNTGNSDLDTGYLELKPRSRF